MATLQELQSGQKNITGKKTLQELMAVANIPEQQPSGFQSLIQDIASPFLRTGLTAGRAIGGLGAILRGDVEALRQATDKRPVDMGYLGEISPVGQTGSLGSDVKEAVGVGLQIGSSVPFAGATKSIAQAGLSGLLKEGAKRGAIEGATGGALFGAGKAMEEQKGAGEIALETALGGSIGALGGGALGGISGLTNKAISQLANRMTPEGRNILLEKQIQKVAQKYDDALNLTKSQRKSEARTGRSVSQFLAREGLPIGTDTTGFGGKVILSADEAIEALEDKLVAESSEFTRVLKDSGAYVDLGSVRDRALSLVDEVGVDMDTAIDLINKEIDALMRQAGKTAVRDGDRILIPADEANILKQKQWAKGKFNRLATPDANSKAGSHRLIGNALKTAIEDVVDDAPIRQMNQRLGDMYEAINILRDRNGSPVQGGFFGKQFARLAGTVIGAKGGPLGSILGNITADQLANMAMNPNVSSYTLSRIKRELAKQGKRNILEMADEIIENRIMMRKARPLLPAPNYIPMPEYKGGLSTAPSQSQIDYMNDLDKRIAEDIERRIMARERMLSRDNALNLRELDEGVNMEDIR